MFLESDRYWAPFCELVGRPDLADGSALRRPPRPRPATPTACAAELDEEFAARTFEEWKELLAGIDAPWAPVQAVEELLDDPQVIANDYLGEVALEDGAAYRLPRVPVQFDERPPDLRRAPEHGEHTEPVLLELGYSWDDIAALGDGRGDPVTGRGPVPVPDEQSAPFWAAAADGVLVIARCGRCATLRPPARRSSARTAATPTRRSRSSRSAAAATVRSWTVVRQSFLPGFDDDVPFVLVDVALDEQDDLRLIGRLLDGPDGAARDRRPRSTVAFEQLADGVAVPAFALEPTP